MFSGITSGVEWGVNRRTYWSVYISAYYKSSWETKVWDGWYVVRCVHGNIIAYIIYIWGVAEYKQVENHYEMRYL